MRISDILESKPITISSASGGINGIDRAKAEKIIDPKGFFARNKKFIKFKPKIPKTK